MGNAEERNGTLMCTDAYAATFGIKSHGTVSRCLNLLKERGLIVCTRKGVRLRKIGALWAATWWPIYYREGSPLDRPEDPTHAYLTW
jgi:hypothetical protein